MSLHVVCDGILETSVSWADFENNLRSALGTGARFGNNKAVIDIGEDVGFTSRCGLITCDWIGETQGEHLPSKVVLKIPSVLPFRKLNDALPDGQKLFPDNNEILKVLGEKLKEVHNIEVCTYDFFEQFEDLTMPRCYYAKSFAVEDGACGQICLEYVENSRMMNLHEEHTVEQVRQIAIAIGKMQACSLKKALEAPEILNYSFADFANHHTTVEAYAGMFKAICAIDKSEETKKLMERIYVILPKYYATNLPSTLHLQMNFRPVIVSGDLRTENVLIDKDTGDLAALIDWQCTHLGVGVEDLLRIALSALTAEERRATTPMLVEAMYTSLVANLHRAEPPYSLETLLLLYNILFPHCALFFVSSCISLITSLERDLKICGTVKAARKAIQLNKIIGALEDILLLDEKNQKRPMTLKFRND